MKYEEDENLLVAAPREFEEETGFQAAGDFVDLGSIKQKSGKLVNAWAFRGDCHPSKLASNTCEIEWPPRSGWKGPFCHELNRLRCDYRLMDGLLLYDSLDTAEGQRTVLIPMEPYSLVERKLE